MDAHTRRMLDEAYELDDECRASYEAMETRNAEQVRHEARHEMIFKTTETPRQQPQPQVDWGHVVDGLAEEVGDVTGRLEKQINELTARVQKLEITNEILRGFITSGKAAPAVLTSIKPSKASDAA